jgi:nitrogen regulatory protein P-II 1
MIKIEAIVQPNRLEQIKDALIRIGVEGMTVSEVRGHGRQKGHTETYRGREYGIDLLPKVKLELVLEDKLVDPAVDAIIEHAATGKSGTGRYFTRWRRPFVSGTGNGAAASYLLSSRSASTEVDGYGRTAPHRTWRR